MLLHFLDFRLEVVTRRLRHELENLLQRIHILEGFAIVFNNLDEAIRIIRASDGKADAAPKLIARFGLSEVQADAILETKLYRLGKLEIADILDELAKKRHRAAEIQALLDDEPARWTIIRGEIQADRPGLRRRRGGRRSRARPPRSSTARKTTSSTRTPGSSSPATAGSSGRSRSPTWPASGSATTTASAGSTAPGRGRR